MKASVRLWRSPWAVLAVLCCAPAALAQWTVHLKAPDSAYAGETFQVEVEVRGVFGECKQPEFPNLPNARVVPAGLNRQTYRLNRRTTRSFGFMFNIIATEPGTLVIPPVPVIVDGQRRRTDSRTVQIRKSDAEEYLALDITTDADPVYVGQEIPLKLAIWVKPARFNQSKLSADDMFRLLSIPRDGIGPFPRPRSYIERTLDGDNGDPENYYVYLSETTFVPTRPGPLAFDDVVLSMKYPTQFGRDIFGQPTIAAQRTITATPKVLKIDVRPLPTENRPATFNGAVGQFEITTSAAPTEVRVGDPITVHLEISGDGPLRSLAAPPLTTQSQLTSDFRVPEEQLAGTIVGARRRFTQVFRPRRADVTEIPPIEFAYFDPIRERYVMTRSEPIPISVAPADTLDTSELTEETQPLRNDDSELVALDGLRGLITTPAVLKQDTATVQTAPLVAALVAPPVAFLAIAGWLTLAAPRTADPTRRRRQRAWKVARQELSRVPDQSPAAAGHALRRQIVQYLSDRTGEPAARFAVNDLESALRARQVDPALAAELQEVMRRSDALAYGGADDPVDELTNRTREALRRLERSPL